MQAFQQYIAPSMVHADIVVPRGTYVCTYAVVFACVCVCVCVYIICVKDLFLHVQYICTCVCTA